MYIPKYIKEIDSIVTNMSDEMSILYLQSDHPDVLRLVLDQDTGSHSLRGWLGIGGYKDLKSVQRFRIARPLTAVYQEKTSYGILGDEEYYRKQCNIKEGTKDPVYLKTDAFGNSPVVYVQGPHENIRVGVSVVDGDPSRKFPDKTITLNAIPIRRYLKSSKSTFYIEIDKTDPLESCYNDIQPACWPCRFFYLTNVDALDLTTISRMMQAFLECRDMYPQAKLVLTGMTRCIPDAMAAQVVLIRLGAPTLEDVRHHLEEKLSPADGGAIPFSEESIESFSKTLTGLTHLQLENVYAYFGNNLVAELSHNPSSLNEAVWRQKELESKKDGILVYQKITENPGVVGVGGFSRWLNENLPDLADTEQARNMGIEPPRGVILAGVPGTGKSQLAKQLAYQWGNFNQHNRQSVSFIEFKIGSLSSSKYGESEGKMEHFLTRISEQAPAVLFVDEVEKTFYRDGQGRQGMHEVKKQQMSMLLAWLQEHKENIFTFMTSNDIDILPPELIRSGRLSERFFVFIPNYIELMSMLYVFLKSKAEKGIFNRDFHEEIEKICGAIEEHGEKYGGNNFGKDAKNDAELDQRLSDIIKAGSLSHVLIALAKYAVNPGDNKIRNWELENMKDLEGTENPWDTWLDSSEESIRTPFLTGADLQELVKNTILKLRRTKPNEKWTGQQFAETMVSCCCCSEFIPYGQSNLKKLAELYLSCDYRDASAHPLLPRWQFHTHLCKFSRNGMYITDTQPDNLYDQFMQQVLMREIERQAGEKKHEEERREFQEEQIRRQKMQWEEEDQDKPEKKAHEARVRDCTRLQLEQLERRDK